MKIIFNCKKNIRKETNIIVVEVYGENILAHNVAWYKCKKSNYKNHKGQNGKWKMEEWENSEGVNKKKIIIIFKGQNAENTEHMRLPGVEPGSIAWKAIILTVGLQTLCCSLLF